MTSRQPRLAARPQARLPRLAAAIALLLASVTPVPVITDRSAHAEQPAADQPIPPIARRIPPAGIKIDPKDRAELERRVTELENRDFVFNNGSATAAFDRQPERDIRVYIKAVKLALQHNEFYKQDDVKLAHKLLDTADARYKLASSRSGLPWGRDQRVVSAYLSSIDGSLQPYGLEIPNGYNFNPRRPQPLYVWLHGRGDKVTDMHFIAQRESKSSPISPHVKDGIILHPFGRHCMGFKSAGEIDVLDAVKAVQKRYNIDPNRIVLMGFSMGGAGVWHIGAHYPDKWCAMSPGAGFAETARYTRLTPEKYPRQVEQALWGVYDVPGYVRNLFNLPVVAYSGEKDKQIQAARVMEEAFKAEGRELTHLIGPGMGHKYHPDTLKQIMSHMRAAVKKGRDTHPKQVALQTRTLRYNKAFWVTATALVEHWKDSRIDARVDDDGVVRVTTKNIKRMTLRSAKKGQAAWPKGTRFVIDGDTVVTDQPERALDVTRFARWKPSNQAAPPPPLRKQHGLQGPIDDAFMSRFIVVRPTGKSPHPQVQRWVEFELNHFVDRWRALYRGEVLVKKDVDVTDRDMRSANLVLWGDVHSNAVLRRMANQLPVVQWKNDKLVMGNHSVDARMHVPMLIYPNPLDPSKYVVVNSGPTHREGHDRTNSLQNPKLGDWALIDITQPPNDTTPGRVVDAGFFDEYWRYKRNP